MTHLRRTLLATAFLTPFASFPAAAAATPCVSSTPYVSGEGGYASYRIPAVVGTRQGTLLAFAEGRRDGPGDTGDIDIVVRRSVDGGCTWGPLIVVAAGDGGTRGNPAPVIDPRTGAVVLVSCANDGDATEARIMRGEAPARRVYVQHSRDDGRCFTSPREITADVALPSWRWYATGPGHALALTRGPYAGRLVVAANHSAAPPVGSPDTGREYRYYGGHALCSDDGGRSWRLGFVDADHDGTANVNESSVAQLPDGRLYFSARDQGGSAPGNRLDALSEDGGTTLSRPYAPQPTLARVPVVQGSVLQLHGSGGPLLFSGPSDPAARRAMTVWRSTDGGADFTPAVTPSPSPAAYSDLVQVDADTVGLLYETGTAGPYETIEFRRLAVGELGGA
ncbi:glycoside hydrolase [Streptomyces sp. NBC_01275]|uniref:sialidase family protein n=1 Tax=Streptomyces sp. NBC_01275 TaxID=2903807 RepID=UPI00224DFA48|nr:sialidase family protein [Streptomyces sp. NBC_01275]MCX4762042.1 glycoside hydrolase [Streptomyces sp. NBC_01275]